MCNNTSYILFAVAYDHDDQEEIDCNLKKLIFSQLEEHTQLAYSESSPLVEATCVGRKKKKNKKK